MKTIAIIIFLLISISATTQPGTVDSSFGANGSIRVEKFYTNCAVIQPDDKILSGGSYINGYSLLRYSPDGIIDSNFGNNGISTISDSLFKTGAITGISLLPNNEIVTGGSAQLHIAAAKFKTNGILDSSFGKNGTVLLTYGEQEFIKTLQIQLDGKILLAGYTHSIEGYKMLLVRLNEDGTIDKGFAVNGRVTNSTGAQINCIAVQKDGKIITAGQFYVNAGESDEFVINRYNSDGSLDKAFGISGTVTTKFGDGYTYPYSIEILNSGKFLVSGLGNWLSGNGKSYMAVAQYNFDGSLDTIFGTNGQTQIIFEGYSSQAKGMSLQTDGKIILGGAVYIDDLFGNGNFALVRLLSNGKLDSSFGIYGKTITDFKGTETSEDVLIQHSGKIVLAGNYQNASKQADGTLIVRYNNDDLSKKQIIIKKIKHYAATQNNAQANSLNNVSIYPNPAQNVLHVTGLLSSNTKLTVVDFIGTIKLQAVTNSSSYNLNIAALNAGNYLLKIQMNGAVVTKKFVKE